MSKKVLVLSASPRKGGNSDVLCEQFIQGAESAGHLPQKIYVTDKKINYCIGCNACQENGGNCIHKDDMEGIMDLLCETDVIVLATPVYFYSMAAQLKALIDRTYSRFTEIANKEIYLIVTGAANAEHYMETAVEGLRGFIACLPGAKERHVIYGINAGDIGTVKSTPAMDEAYEVGKAI